MNKQTAVLIESYDCVMLGWYSPKRAAPLDPLHNLSLRERAYAGDSYLVAASIALARARPAIRDCPMT
jgi:hypothetical protein